jgi:hypothetical protein
MNKKNIFFLIIVLLAILPLFEKFLFIYSMSPKAVSFFYNAKLADFIMYSYPFFWLALALIASKFLFNNFKDMIYIFVLSVICFIFILINITADMASLIIKKNPNMILNKDTIIWTILGTIWLIVIIFSIIRLRAKETK